MRLTKGHAVTGLVGLILTLALGMTINNDDGTVTVVAGADRLPSSAADPGSPANADHWYQTNTGQFRHKTAVGVEALVGLLFVNTAESAAISNTAVETDFDQTYSIPASTLTANKAIRFTGYGRYSTAVAAPTLNFAIKYGATDIATTGAITCQASATNVGWALTGLMSFRAVGASATVAGNVNGQVQSAVGAANDGVGTSNGTVAVNTTVPNTLRISVLWSTASTSNSIVLEQVTFEAIN